MYNKCIEKYLYIFMSKKFTLEKQELNISTKTKNYGKDS